MEDDLQVDVYFKVIVIGEPNVGKSQLLNILTTGKFQETNIPTFGIDFKKKEVIIMGKKVIINFWDTAGQEKYKTFSKSFFQFAKGIVLLFDLSSRKTFESIDYWVNEVRNRSESNAPIFLIGS